MTEVVTKVNHYARFFYDDWQDQWTAEAKVESRDHQKVKLLYYGGTFGRYPYAFLLFDKTGVQMPDGEIIEGKERNLSGAYYPGGKVMTLEEVIRESPEADLLARDVKEAGGLAVKTNEGKIIPLYKGDMVVK